MRHAPYQVGDAIPALLRDVDLMRIFDLSKTRFYQLKKAGHYDRFIVERHPVTLYSGSMVQRFLDGQLADTRYFQSARKRSA